MADNEKVFPQNPNYKPGDWPDSWKESNENLTGIPVIDAAEKIRKRLETGIEAVKLLPIDPLTGCHNLNYYNDFKKNFDINRDANRIAIIYIDLNDFKPINDKRGHSVGDVVLKDLVSYLRSLFRVGDDVVRLGGDEFVIICHNHKNREDFEGHLIRKMERVREGLSEWMNLNCEVDQIEDFFVDFAYGVAIADINLDKKLDDVLIRADNLMYKDKEKRKEALKGEGVDAPAKSFFDKIKKKFRKLLNGF